MHGLIEIAPLRLRPQYCAFFAEAFQQEWPSWYGADGPGNAEADVREFANPRGDLPVGVVAIGPASQPLGIAALKASSVASHAHLSPWATAGYVAPAWRRRGIGALLLAALRLEAARLGYAALYCATATSASLLARDGWTLLDTTLQDGCALQIFHCAVPPPAR